MSIKLRCDVLTITAMHRVDIPHKNGRHKLLTPQNYTNVDP